MPCRVLSLPFEDATVVPILRVELLAAVLKATMEVEAWLVGGVGVEEEVVRELLTFWKILDRTFSGCSSG